MNLRDLASLGYDVDTSGLLRGQNEVDKLRRKSILARQGLTGINTGTKTANTGLVKMEAKTASATAGLARFNSGLNAVKALLIGGVFAIGISGLANMVEGYKDVNSLLKIVTDSSVQYNEVQTELYAIAQGNYGTIKNTTKLYAGQARQLEALGYSQGEQLKTVELFNQALATGGSNVAESAAATLQWVQAISSGLLRGQEFNSIMENGRGVAIALAEGLDVPIGRLRTMSLEGELGARKVIDALLRQADVIKERFANIPLTIGRAMTQLTNTATVKLSELNDSVGDFTGGIAKAISGVSSFSDELDMDRLVFSISAAGLAITGVLIPAITRLGVAIAVALAKNPLGLMITGITYASVKLYEFSDQMVEFGDESVSIRDIVGGTWDYIKSQASIAIEAMKDGFTEFKDSITDGKSWGELLELAYNTINKILGAFVVFNLSVSNIWDEMGIDWDIAMIKMSGAFDGFVSYVVLRITKIGEALAFVIKEAIILLSEQMREAGQAVGLINGDLGVDIVQSSIKMRSSAYDILTTAEEKSLQAVKDYKSELGSVEDKVTTLTDKSNILKDSFKAEAKQAYEVDYLGIGYNALGGIIDDIQEKSSNRKFMREFEEDIESLGGNMHDSSIRTDELADGIDNLNNKFEETNSKKTKSTMAASLKALAEGYEDEIAALDRRELAITANDSALKEHDLTIKTYGKDLLKLSRDQIAEIVNRDRSISLLEKEKEKREELAKEVEEAHNAYKDLIEANDAAVAIKEMDIDLTTQQYEQYLLLDDVTKELFKKEVKRAELFEDGEELRKDYLSDLEDINEDLEYNKTLLNRGESAAQRSLITRKYGNTEMAKTLIARQKENESIEAAIDLQKEFQSALESLVKGDSSIEEFGDALLDAVYGDEMEKRIKKLSDSLLGVFKSDDINSFQGAISGVLDGITNLFSEEGGLSGMIQNYQMGSTLSEAFGGGEGAQTGSGVGAIIGAYFGGSAGAAAGSVIGGWFGSLFDDDEVYATLANSGVADAMRENYLKELEEWKVEYAAWEAEYGDDPESGVYAPDKPRYIRPNGWYNNKYDTENQEFYRESAFGSFGLLHGGTKNIGGGENLANLMTVLDRMQDLDAVMADFLPESEINRISLAIHEYNTDGMDMEQAALSRLRNIISNFAQPLKDLVPEDTYRTLEETSDRLLDIQQSANIAVPYLQSIGYNLTNMADIDPEQFKDLPYGMADAMMEVMKTNMEIVSISTAQLIKDAAGGYERLVELNSNYVDSLLTESEQVEIALSAANQRIDAFNLDNGFNIQSADELKSFIDELKTSGALLTEVGRESLIASLEVADAFAYVNAELERLAGIVNVFSDFESPLSLIKAGSDEAKIGLVELSGSITTLTASMNGYISNILSAEEQTVLSQVQAAQTLNELAADLDIDASLLGTRETFKQLVADANNASLLATEAGRETFIKLLDASSAVAAVADSGQSLADIIASAPDDLLNFSIGIESVSSELDNVYDSLSDSVDLTSQIADNLNDIDYSIDKVIDISAFNRDKEQGLLEAMKSSLAKQEELAAKNENLTVALLAASQNSLAALRDINTKTPE